MICGLHAHPENPLSTKAFELVKKGRREEALKITSEGEVQKIEGWLEYLKNHEKPTPLRRRKARKA